LNIKEIKELVRLVNDTDIAELQIETDATKVTIKKGQAISHPQAMPAHLPVYLPATAQPQQDPGLASPAVATAVAPVITSTEEISENHLIIAAPMVGTFYRASSPDAAPYVEVGSIIQKGQPVCIIEAMKLMNEIESEDSGRLIKILVENAQPVEYGQPLFILEKV
jgi:oxaloacetate decarboxylase alpha subunit